MPLLRSSAASGFEAAESGANARTSAELSRMSWRRASRVRKRFALTKKFPETDVVHALAATRVPLQATLPPEHWPIWKVSPCSPAGPKNVHVGVHPAPVQAQSAADLQ